MTKSLVWRIAPIAVGALLLAVAHHVPAEYRPTNIGLGVLTLLGRASILFGMLMVLSSPLRTRRPHPLTEQSSQRAADPGDVVADPVVSADAAVRSSLPSAQRRAEDKIAHRFAVHEIAAPNSAAPGGDVPVIFTFLLGGVVIWIGIVSLTSGAGWSAGVLLIGCLAVVAAGLANGRNLRRS